MFLESKRDKKLTFNEGKKALFGFRLKFINKITKKKFMVISSVYSHNHAHFQKCNAMPELNFFLYLPAVCSLSL